VLSTHLTSVGDLAGFSFCGFRSCRVGGRASVGGILNPVIVCVRYCLCTLLFVYVIVCVRYCLCTLLFVYVIVCVRYCLCTLLFVYEGIAPRVVILLFRVLCTTLDNLDEGSK
jgi:hypothetical protein